MKNNPMDNQFVVSYELLQLLEWLLLFEQGQIKRIVEHALEQGLDVRLSQAARKSSKEQKDSGEDMKQFVVEFFSLLESLMLEVLQEKEATSHLSRLLIPALDHIDTRMLDPESMAVSIAKAQTVAQRKPQLNAKEVLCKELLKRWKPTKKAFLN